MSSELQISSSQEQGNVPVTVLKMQGEIDTANAHLVQEAAEKELAAGAKNMILDLTGITYVSSSGLRAIHIIYKSLEPEAGEGGVKSAHLKLVSPPAKVLGIMKAIGFDRFLEVFDSQAEALASF